MADQKMIRLSQAAKKLNVGISTISEHLSKHGYDVGLKPNTKITSEQFDLLVKEFESSIAVKQEAAELTIGSSHSNIVINSDIKEKSGELDEEFYVPTEKEASDEEKGGEEKSLEQEADNVVEEPQEAPVSDTQEAVLEEKEESEGEDIKSSISENEEDTEDKQSIKAKLRGLKVIDKIDLTEPRRKKSTRQKPEKEARVEKLTAKVEAKTTPKKQENITEEAKPKKEEVKSEEAPKTEAAEKEHNSKEVVSEDKKDSSETTKVISKDPKTTEQKPSKEVAESQKPKAVEKDEVEDSSKNTIENDAESESTIEAKADKLKGLKVVGKIDLPSGKKKAKPVASSDQQKEKRGKRKRVKRERISKPNLYNESSSSNNNNNNDRNKNNNKKKTTRPKKEEVSQKEVDASFKKTKAKLTGGNKDSKTQSKRQYRKEKRSANLAAREKELMQERENASTLKITEFVPANELATMMEVSINDIISKFLSMGMFVSINQRLDADTITIIADEFGYNVEFTSAEDDSEIILESEDKEEDLKPRDPIVTIMGHVDHGKTSLLDYIRDASVAEGEAGGITQHIGAYTVNTQSGRRLVFLDTPGHEAFTAMRARGAKVTDVVIIVIAADDNVMPQTIEAINHAQVAGVPIVIAINKVDRPNANPHKIKEELSNINILVEDWGGKYQSYEISAKTGQGIEDLLEGLTLEADLLELKANPDKNGVGTVIEASLDKGRGYVTTMLVQTGTMEVGDIMLAGHHYGKVKAMTDYRGKRLKKVGPSTPVQVLGLSGAPQAGDKLNILDSEREAREIANKRQQIIREQSIRATKRTTLSDIGKRIEIGNFQQLNVIVKGDVDGSVEALSDSLLKLSTDEIEINIIHKAVGAISEGDILLASASDAIVIGFQVRPTASGRKLAEKEEIEVRLYSVIYDAINDVKDAMEGLLAPDFEENIVGNAEVREIFKISKVGTIAGCMVTDGYIKRNSKIRLIRDGIVIYGGGGENADGEINALKRYKDDTSEVRQGFECGISIKNYNDLKVGDIIEAYEIKEVKRSL